MTTRRLRIWHNGHVHQKKPHWHLWIYRNGSLRGEIIGHQSDFKSIQSFDRQLTESEIAKLFAEAESICPHFKPEVVSLTDDVMVELNEYVDGKEQRLLRFNIPQAEQSSPVVLAFLGAVNQIFEPYA